jgi:hypothetical protein
VRSRRWVVSQKRPRATRVVFGKFACLPPCRIDQNAAGESKRFCFGVHGTTSSASQTFRLERPSRRQVVTQVTPSGSVTRTENRLDRSDELVFYIIIYSACGESTAAVKVSRFCFSTTARKKIDELGEDEERIGSG